MNDLPQPGSVMITLILTLSLPLLSDWLEIAMPN